ncbi:MAG: hypothetical protein ACRCZE_02035 [Candidatus Altimarinota bacterium]
MSNLSEEELAEVAKLEKINPGGGSFQRGLDRRYLLGSDYPVGTMFVLWSGLLIVPLLIAFYFFPDLAVEWRQILAKSCLAASFGSVLLITILYWQKQVKEIWMSTDNVLFYMVRSEEKILNFSDYKYVQMVGEGNYIEKLIFTNWEKPWQRYLMSGALNFWPEKTVVMPLMHLVEKGTRQPVSAKKLTNFVGKVLLKEGFEIQPVPEKDMDGPGWIAVRKNA